MVTRQFANIAECGTHYTVPYKSNIKNVYKYSVSAMRESLNQMKSLVQKGYSKEGMVDYWNNGNIKGFIQVTAQNTLNINVLFLLSGKIQPYLQFYLKTFEIASSTSTSSLGITLEIFTAAKIFLVIAMIYILLSFPLLYYFVMRRISRSFKHYNSTISLLPNHLMMNNPLLTRYWKK